MSRFNKVIELHKSAISKSNAKMIKEWFDGDYSKLSFDNLFSGNLRVAIPFKPKRERSLASLVAFLRDDGWMPSGNGGYFNTKMVTQKMRREGGEEYDEEVEVADLKLVKHIQIAIPAGPRQGEVTTRSTVSSISKVLSSPKVGAPKALALWWSVHGSEYVKDYNWKQIETAFRSDGSGVDYSVIISRSPIDVLRMSDHERIRSCHSEGSSYFNCAITEAKGTGLVAYLVETGDLDDLLRGEPRPDETEEAASGAGAITLGSIDDKEIFEDSRRGVRGIAPKSRVRLRKYRNDNMDYEFAAPEHSTYGPHPPGFVDVVRAWAWNAQKDLFDGERLPDLSDLTMVGGGYRDANDGVLLRSFFSEGGHKNLATRYLGNADIESGDDENQGDMWDAEVEAIQERADADCKNVSFYAEVHDYDADGYYVSASANLRVSIPLTGWADYDGSDSEGYEAVDAEGEPDNRFVALPGKAFNWGYGPAARDFKNLFEHPEYGELSLSMGDGKEPQIDIDITFNGDDVSNPDEAGAFLSYVITDIDRTVDSYRERVRKKLINGGYIGELEYDRAARRLEDGSFENFNVYGDDDDMDGEVLIGTKPKTILFSKPIPSLLLSDQGAPMSSASIKEFLIEALGARSASGQSMMKFLLKDEDKSVVTNVLLSIRQSALRQLEFDFGDKWARSDNLSLGNLELAMKNSDIFLYVSKGTGEMELGINITLKVTGSELEASLIEEVVRRMDKSIDLISFEIKSIISDRVEEAHSKRVGEVTAFYSGAKAGPVIEELSASPQEDVRRLALWVNQNWEVFNNAEKEVAYFSFLMPAARDGDYVHSPELNAPKFWDSIIQKRHDTAFGYHWTGSSMKDVDLPKWPPSDSLGTEDTIAGEENGPAPDSSLALTDLRAWLLNNGFKKEAEQITNLV